MKDVFKIGVIGCGDISTRNYVPNIMDRFSNMEIYALCDLNRERAESLAAAHGIAPVSYTHLDVYKRQEAGIPVRYLP